MKQYISKGSNVVEALWSIVGQLKKLIKIDKATVKMKTQL